MSRVKTVTIDKTQILEWLTMLTESARFQEDRQFCLSVLTEFCTDNKLQYSLTGSIVENTSRKNVCIFFQTMAEFAANSEDQQYFAAILKEFCDDRLLCNDCFDPMQYDWNWDQFRCYCW